MRKLLTLLLLSASPCLAAQMPTTELFLAGGALKLCSDLAAADCGAAHASTPHTRTPARFVFDTAGTGRAADPSLWRRLDAPTPAQLQALLATAASRSEGLPLSSDAATELLDGLCLHHANDQSIASDCRSDSSPRPWRQWLDEERSAVLAAMEVPQLQDGVRSKERAFPHDSRVQGGLEVVEAFVEAARRRASGAVPRIAVVTASAYDPFDPVDFYLSLFTALGAEVEWWPIDAALNAAVASGRCETLDAARREQLHLPGRERVYPDLAAQQARACTDPQALANVPALVHGVFFSGGDQWRLRRALVDADDRPNAWLQSLRRAHAAGSVVVGGTSAGAAVQSGGAMLSNGTSAEALQRGALSSIPPSAGCDRAGACPAGLVEDSFTWWPAGGTGLATAATVDTHFSERARELRLLTLMQASATPWGYGADETSAIRVTAHAHHTQLQAFGEHGGWVFEQVAARAGGGLEARVHYLAPGATLQVIENRLRAPPSLGRTITMKIAGTAPVDALSTRALREAAARLVAGDLQSLTLKAGAGEVVLRRSEDTRVWRGPGSQVGITDLLLSYRP